MPFRKTNKKGDALMKLEDRQYEILKWIAQIVLPALGTLYFALSTIWGLPYGEQIIGTITAVDTFLGALLGISTSQYRKTDGDGVLVIDESNPDKDVWRLEFNDDLDKLKDKTHVTFRVGKSDDNNRSTY